MPKAIRFEKNGGPEVLQYVDVEVGAPGPGQAQVRHHAIGLNFIDCYVRSGLYPSPLPSALGTEGAGEVLAIGEGVILGSAYWIAGVPSPVLLGVITAFMAMVPGGAPLACGLVSLYLVGSGEPLTGAALFAWGSIELFIVDKTLRPRLVGGPVKLPFLPTFFGLVGGVTTMGFVGLFIGPVLMALLVALWREWVLEVQLKAEQPPS